MIIILVGHDLRTPDPGVDAYNGRVLDRIFELKCVYPIHSIRLGRLYRSLGEDAIATVGAEMLG